MIDYTSVTPDAVRAVTDDALEDAEAMVTAIVSSSEPPTLDNTIRPLDDVGAVLARAYGRGAFMGRVHPDADVRDAGTDAAQRLAAWGTDLVFRRDLYERVRDLSTALAAEDTDVDPVARRLVDHWMRDFRRAGHDLDDDARAALHGLRRRLVDLEIAFARNLAEWDDGLDATPDELAGVPDEIVARLQPGAEPGTLRVTLDYPTYRPVMRHAHDRELRRRLQEKFWNRAAELNRPLLQEAVEIRRRVADLLGHPTWAHHAMEIKMAGRPKAVQEFYESLIPGLTARGEVERDRLAELLREDVAADRLESWDSAYYMERLRRRDFDLDPEAIAAYFPLESTVAGMFELAEDMFGIRIERHTPARAWHPDVELFSITDEGAAEPRAWFFTDFFPREGKYGHAAVFPLQPKTQQDAPVAALVANFSPPGADRPSLLRHDEVRTLFHEFGHVLHYCLSDVEVYRFGGFSAEWDFVEAPSQIMENWIWEPEVLARFARHHETGEVIPTELVERMRAARDLHAGLETLRQVFLGKLDLAYHGSSVPPDLDAAYREAYAHTLLPFHEGTFFPASFGHLMGGYDAGYYGYLWSRVYGDDMYSVFTAEGVTNPDVGRRYRREILATGGSRDAMEHLKAFLGRDPSPEAFLRKLGLDETGDPT